MLTDHHDNQYDKVACMALRVVSILSSSEVGKELDQSKPPITASKPLITKGVATKPAATKPPVLAKKPVVGAELEPVRMQKLNEYFRKFVVELLKMFEQDRTLLENKGSFIIR